MRIKMNLKRVLSFVLALFMVLGMVNIMPTAHAAGAGTTLYLKPNNNWKSDNARFAAYFFGAGEKWVSMTDSNGDGFYEVTVPSGGYTSIVFCRMNPSAAANNWNNKWNQTSDLTIPTNSNICYTVSEGAWDKGSGSWATGWTVTFNMNGHGTNTTQSVPKSGKAVRPADPTAEGYTFGGWYTDAACTSAEYTFTGSVTANITLYAKWVENAPDAVYYDVTFDMNGHGASVDTQVVIENGKAVKPVDPTADGWLFRGWYTDAEGNTAYDFNTAVTDDVTLYAKWMKIEDVAVSLHFQKPADWGSVINAWIWGGDGKPLPGYEQYNTEWPGTAVTDTNGDGWYDVTVKAKTGQTVYFIFNDGTNQTGNLTTGELSGSVELWAQGENVFNQRPIPNSTYIIAGNSAAMFGSEWTPSDTANKMTYNVDTGLFEKTYTAVPAGSYAFKVTDGTWTNSWGGTGADGNYEFTLSKTADVTIKFNEGTKDVTRTWTYYPVVTFDMQGHGTSISAEAVTPGGKVGRPADPSAEGCTFGGWYTNAECSGEPYDFNAVVNADITLYAKWTINQYTVTFVTGEGGTAIAPITADFGTTVVAPANPTREGYKFTGWDVEIPATMPARNVTVTAMWALDTGCVVSFNMNGHGTAVEPQNVGEGEKAVAPTAPTAEGYTFGGWYTDAECSGEVYSFDTAVSTDIILYAKWTVNQYTITFVTGEGGTEIAPITADYGTAIVVPANPTREGYQFTGWDVEIPATMPAGNLTATAQWKELCVVTVHYYNEDLWGTVYGYMWYFPNGEKVEYFGGWPGKNLIDEDRDGWLDMTVTLEESQAFNFIFNNGDGSKTADLATGSITGTTELWVVGSEKTVHTVKPEVSEPEPLDYYLVGYINGADYGIKADSANFGEYKFVDGKVTAKFTADSYVVVKDSNGTVYSADGYCTDISVILKTSGFKIEENKMFAPCNVDLEYTLVVNADGTLTLSYTVRVDEPEIPEGANTVTIHFLRPSGWKAIINAYMWTEEGGEKVEALGSWPGKPISGNEKAGWYDLTVATDKTFNFIFNDGSNQNGEGLSTGEITGPTELWVIGETVYTSAPREWTHYTVTVHYQNSNGWSSVNTYAWWGVSNALMGEWPGSAASPSVNPGWYNAVVYVEVGKELKLIFNNGNSGSGNQTSDIELGVITGNAELWFDGSGSQTDKPAGWVDETRTIHLPGTIGGNAWNAAGNRMTYDVERGLYTITFEDVAPGTYEYKIAANGNWNENYGTDSNGNYSVTVPETQDVTFWYSDSSHRVVCSVNYDIDAVVSLTGTGIAEGTRLTDPELDGLYTLSLSLPAGTYDDLKIVCGEMKIEFAAFTISAGKDITFSFDPATGMGYHNGSNVKVDTTHIFYDTKDLDYKDPFGAVAVGESVKFSITTGTDATGVTLVVKGIATVGLEKTGDAVNGVQRWTCTYAFESIGEYDYYFTITNGSDMVVYCDDTWNNHYKTGDYGTGSIGNLADIFAYDIVVYEAGFETPDWMKNAVIYQIFPDRFFDAIESNNDDQTTARGTVDYEYVTDWYMLPENPEMLGKYPDDYPIYALKGDGEWSNEIYGGDLKGITERIGYLKALGVTVIYLNPVFSSISNHRYDACDYTEIDPILGTLGDFEELVAVAEANGMYVVLDGVFNHVSDDSVYFDRYYKFLPLAAEKYDGKIGAYPYWAYVYDLMNEQGYTKSAAETAARKFFSENYGITDYSYTEWFLVENKKASYADTIGLRAGKKVYTYEGWWGYDSMPVIKSTNGSEYQTGNWAEEMLSHENQNSVNAYWITKGMDGWRLDVANEVSDETWQNFRDSVKALSNNNAVIIGEIWADATHYLMGDMYDSVMNYIFRDAVAGFARGYLIERDTKKFNWDDDYTADDALTTLEILRERYPEEAFYAMMNLVASHDTARILSYLDDVEDDRYQKDLANNFPLYETTSDRAKQLQYVVAFIQFTYAGAPTIYYGDEIGMTGCDDPDDRRAFTWGMGQQDLVEWYAQLAAIRAQYPALRTGSVEPFAPDRDVMGYIRRDANNTLTVLANRASYAKTIALEGTYVDLISGKKFTDSIVVPAYRGVILVAENEVKSYTVNTAALAPAYDPAYIVAERSVTPPADPNPNPNPNPNPDPVTYVVSFDSNGYGDYVYEQYVQEGSSAYEPDAPIADAMVFLGWFVDAECTEAYDFDSAVTEDITLYAGWQKVSYTVTFSMSGRGWEVSARIVTAGEAISAPRVPVVEGYSFGGWFCDADCTEKYVFGDPVISDITLYAKWVEKIVHAEVYEDLDKEEPYYSSVDFVIESGLMIGTGEAVFAPNENMTRAMMWTVLARMDGSELDGEEAWYDNNRKWAIKAGLTDGSAPNNGITCQEMIVMLWRYMGKPVAADDLDGYADAESVSSWAYDAMAWAVEIALIGTDAETALTPNETATRAEAAALMERLCSMIDQKKI